MWGYAMKSLMSIRNKEINRMSLLKQIEDITNDISYAEASGDRLMVLKLLKKRQELKRLL